MEENINTPRKREDKMNIFKKRKKFISNKTILFVIAFLLCVSAVFAQNARIYIEVRVLNDDESGHKRAFQSAMLFVNAIDFVEIKSLELPNSGYVDAQTLVNFLPPPLKGIYGCVETIEGPKINNDMLVPYAHVNYFRGEGEPWDEVAIDIIDVGNNGSSLMRNMHLNNKNKEYTESTTINGCETTIFRAPFTGDGHEIQIAVAISVGKEKLDWIKISVAAMAGTQKGVKIWSLAARFTNGTINASLLTTSPGALDGPNFEEHIISAMTDQNIPAQIAEAFAAPVWLGWEKWAMTFSIPSFPAFPSFAAYPAPNAPPTATLPIPLNAATFNRDLLKADVLKVQILSRLGKWKQDPDAQKAVERFAEWFDETFTSAMTKSQICNLMGQGPVPTYAPPKIPTGSVVTGSIISSPGCFTNLQF